MFSFSDWFNSRKRSAKNSRKQKQNRLSRMIEVLEDRCVPATFVNYNGGTLSQNFDTLINTGTVTGLTGTTPIGIDVAPYNVGAAGSLDGWAFQQFAGGTTRFNVDNGGLATGSAYSYGTGAGADRALGLLASGSNTSRIGAIIRNNTAATITSITVDFTGEQWRQGDAVPDNDTLTFEYQTGAAGTVNIGTAAGWTANTNGNFTAVAAPNPATANAPLDGNNAANRTARSATLSGLSWGVGQDLVIRWSDLNDGGNDDGLAIDDFNLSPGGLTDAVIALSSTTYSKTEGNTGTSNATVTVTRSGNLNNEVSVVYATSAGTATAGTDYTNVTNTLTFGVGVQMLTFDIPVIGDTDIEPNETVNITLSGQTVVSGGGTVSLGTPNTGTLTIFDDDSPAPAGVVLNEIYTNPPSTDTPNEYIELRNTTASPVNLNNVWVVVVEGDNGSGGGGTADRVINLTGQTIPANGFLTIRSASSTLVFPPADATHVYVNAPVSFDSGSGALENDSQTYLLVFSPTAIVEGTDYDASPADGTLEGALGAATVLDSVAYRDGDISDPVYGPLLTRFAATTPDAITRKLGNNTINSAAAWDYSDIAGSTNADLVYDESLAPSSFPIGGRLTPGDTNYAVPAAGAVRFTAAGFTGNEGGTITVSAERIGGTTGAILAVVTAADLSSAFPGTESFRATNGTDYTGSPAAVNVIGATWSAGTATITTTAAHGLLVGEAVAIAGINPAGYNGGFIVTAVGSATAFSYALASNPGTYVGLGSTTEGFPLSWTGGESGSKSFTINVAQDVTVEGNEAFQLTLAGISGGAVTSTRTANGVINAEDLATAAPVVYLNEIKNDGEGDDAPNEYIELRGTAGQSLQNVYVVSVEGDNNVFQISAATWTVGVATITTGTLNHGFAVNDTVTISGVTPAGYNGTYTITAVTATTFSYALATDPGGAGTGGIAGNQFAFKPGTFDYVFDLSSFSLGSNGLLVIRAATGVAVQDPATTVVTDVRLATPNGILENGTNSWLVVYSPTALVQATAPGGGVYEQASDYDRDDNGSFEVLPTGAVLLDGIGWSDGTFGDIAYGTFLTSRPTDFSPNGNATRILESTTPFSTNGWRHGDPLFLSSIIPGVGNSTELRYDYANSNAPIGGGVTPGAANFSGVENPNGTFVLSAANYSVAENVVGGTVTVTVQRVGGSTGTVTVQYATSNGTATQPGDYSTATGTLTFNDGVLSQTFQVTIIDDAVAEAREFFNVTLSNPTGGATIGTPGAGTVTIFDNDGTAPANIVLNELDVDPPSTDNPFEYVEFKGPASAALSNLYFVSLDGDGAAVSGVADVVQDLNSFALGTSGLAVIKSTSGGFTIPGGVTIISNIAFFSGSALENGTNSFLLVWSQSAPIVEGVDYDANNDGTLELPAGAVIVDAVGWSDGTVGDLVYGGVTLTQNTSHPGAATRFPTNQTPLTLAAWYNGTIVDTTGNSSLGYNAIQASTNLPTGAVLTPGAENYPNSGPGTLQFSGATFSVAENVVGGLATITVTRTGGGQGAASVNWSVTGGTATGGGVDYTATPAPLTWLDGEVGPKTFTISIVNDLLTEGPETVLLQLSGATGATLGTQITTTLTINDDETPAADVRLNEIYVNPPDTDDTREYVEIKAVNGGVVSLAGLTLLEIEGDSTTGRGTIDMVVDLSTLSTGTAGFLTLGTNYATSNPYGLVSGATTLANLIRTPATMENGAVTFLLVTNFTGVLGTDYDVDNNGVLDSTPWGQIVDSVAWLDGGTAGSVSYAGAPVIPMTPATSTQDAVTRFKNNNTASSLAAWWGGDILNDATDLTYDPAIIGSGNIPTGAVLTPGAMNFEPAATTDDFGDLPDVYGTLLASNGARHTATGPTLGTNRDAEANGQPSTDALLDDTTGTPDDEDGVTFSSLTQGLAGTATVNVSAAARLDAWVDWNNDGDFADLGEQIADNLVVAAGNNVVNFTVPATAATQVYSRFRLSTVGDLNPTGAAVDGEVEDYRTSVAAAGSTYTLSSATYATAEGQSFVTITVTRSNGSGTGSVDIVTANGTATSTADYTGGTFTVNFINGQLVATQNIVIADDAVVDDDETFTLTLANPVNGTLGAITNATVTIDDPVLAISNITTTTSGFVARFNRAFATDATVLNLYEPTTGGTAFVGGADLTVREGGVIVYGTLVLDPVDKNKFTWIKTDAVGTSTFSQSALEAGILTPGTNYSLLVKASTGTADHFEGRDGRALNGGDFTQTLTGPASTTYLVSIPNVVRGGSETAVTIPAGFSTVPNTLAGIPVFVNTTNGLIESVGFNVEYDPTLLDITSATVSSQFATAGFSVSFNPDLGTAAPGLKKARVVLFTGGAGITTGTHIPMVFLQANVPTTAPVGAKAVLDLQAIEINGSFLNNRDNDGVNIAAYFGDVEGDKDLDPQDITRVAQVAGQVEFNNTLNIFPGFASSAGGQSSFQLADPALLADIDQSGGVVAPQDLTREAQNNGNPSLASNVPEIPVIPVSPSTPTGGADPRLYIPNFTATAGSTFQAVVRMHVTEPTGLLLESIGVALSFDATRFQISNINTPVPNFSSLGSNANNTLGTANLQIFTGTLGNNYNNGDDLVIFTFDVTVLPTAPIGSSPLNIRVNNDAFTTAVNGGAATLNPAPTNNPNDPNVDGAINVVGANARAFIVPVTNATAGALVTVPIRVQAGTAFLYESGGYAISFDQTKLQLLSADNVLAGFATLGSNLDNVNGRGNINHFTGTLGFNFAANETQTAINLVFQVLPTASGTTPVDIRVANDVYVTAINGGAVTLIPAPTNATNDANIDGVVNIQVNGNKPPFNSVPNVRQTFLTGTSRVFSTANGNAITVTDPDAGTLPVTTTLTVSNGTLALGPTVPGTVTVTGNSTGNVQLVGPTADITTALNGLTYSPPAGFFGDLALNVVTNDGGNTGFGGPLVDTRSVQLRVVKLFISEVRINDGDNLTSTGNGNEYLEIRSSAPSFTIPNGVYFVGVEGDDTQNQGLVQDVFDLGGFVTGSNGYLALIQRNAGFGGGQIISAGTVVGNVATGTLGANPFGFGNGATNSRYDLDEGGPLGTKDNVHVAGTRVAPEVVGDIENASASFFLLSTGTAPTTAQDIDTNNDGVIDAVFSGWNLFDSVGLLDGTSALDAAYGQINFRNGAGNTLAGSTVVPTSFVPDYVARLGEFAGFSTGEWVGSDSTNGGATAALGANTAGIDPVATLDDIGGINLFAPHVTGVDINGDGSVQRSQITSIVVTFSSLLDQGTVLANYANVFSLTRQGGGNPNVVVSLVDDSQGFTVVLLTFTGTNTYLLGNPDPNGFSNIALNDGVYTLSINGGLLTVGGVQVDADRNGVAGGIGASQFHRLFGDQSGDNKVDNAAGEATAFGNALGSLAGQANYLWYFDYDGDGDIDNNDLDQFGLRYDV